MTRPIAFLDIDGVLNSKQYLAPLRGQKKLWSDWIDPAAVARLNTLVARVPGVQFVLSSAWRLSHSVQQMQDLLDGKGFEGDLISCTPDHEYQSMRAGEIQAWLRANPDVRDFVIFDDNEDAGVGLSARFVQTNPDVGLTSGDVQRAVEILS